MPKSCGSATVETGGETGWTEDGRGFFGYEQKKLARGGGSFRLGGCCMKVGLYLVA